MAADNVTANAGSGGAVFRTFSDATNEWPAAVVAYVTGGSAGAWTLQQVDSTHGLPVNVLNSSLTVAGTVTANAGTGTFAVSAASLPLPAGAATAAKQPALGTAGAASADVLTVQGVASMTALKVDGSAVTQPVSLAANVTVVGTGTFAVQAAQSGAWNVGTVTTVTTVSAVTSITNAVTVVGAAASGAAKGGNPVQVGAVFNTTQPTVTTGQAVEAQATARGALIVGTGVDTFHVTVDAAPTTTVTGTVSITANSSVNLNQVAGAGVATGHGTAAGAVRVELPTDGAGAVGLNAGTNLVGKVGIDQTTPGTTNGVTPVPATSGGPTVARVKAASGTNATNVKASAGQVYGWALYNNAASMRAVHVYDSASAPTAGSGTPKFTILVPASGGANVEWSMGVPFSSGIGYTITTGAGDSDTGSCTADDVHGVLLYK